MQLQKNLITKIAYKGGNQAFLMNEKEKEGYKSDFWITYLQARSLNKKLKEAKGRGVCLRTFPNGQESRKDKEGKVKSLEVSYPKYFYVFNSDLLVEIEK